MKLEQLRKGDKIRITIGIKTYEGVVRTAVNYTNIGSNVSCWYIEMDSPEYGYMYWKQDQDGGTVRKL